MGQREANNKVSRIARSRTHNVNLNVVSAVYVLKRERQAHLLECGLPLQQQQYITKCQNPGGRTSLSLCCELAELTCAIM